MHDMWSFLLPLAVVPLGFYLGVRSRRARGGHGRLQAGLAIILGISLGLFFAFRLLVGALMGQPVSPADLLCFVTAVYIAYTGFKEHRLPKTAAAVKATDSGGAI